ncbi:endolytic transglycosylase MltG [Gordonia sp. ABSL1-1]|uniref:endolytic transglycosylase MltG n=1 Tax=Gordonia sp. ABSL1-1 TaxID=3053923 RepID=UPI002573CDB0|nr:endolytic transglycosylase MltG [Gordonia sp. ABSL1-1]MDL9937304.1 endolytic transglycosylase MltG [Gordonia sp. ABSL1-1]
MSDDRRRNRHRDHVDQPGIDPERLRYFTQPADGGSGTRHRRRREPSVAPDAQQAPWLTQPQAQVRRQPPPVRRTPPPQQQNQVPGDPDASRADERSRREPAYTDTHVVDIHAGPRVIEPAPPGAADRAEPRTVRPAGPQPEVVGLADLGLDLDDDPGRDGGDLAVGAPAVDETGDGYRPDEPLLGARPRRRRRTKKRRAVLVAVVACLLVAVIGVGYIGLRATGLLDSRKDYSNAAGTGDVIVDIPDNSTLRDFGQILVDNDVVGSVKAFTNAADGQAISGGYYKLRTEIPAATAVAMLTDGTTNRVGRIVVPEGRTLDTKTDAQGRQTPGIFEMIADATGATINGQRVGVTVDQLRQAAADGTVEQLGIPSWATVRAGELTGDHRRIEGLIAPVAWERINPAQTATQILNALITASTRQYAAWGFPEQNESTLDPYDTLVAASMVQGEVNQPDDYAKVARVILNRLEVGQPMQFDSTANYTAERTDLNVHSDVLRDKNPWNTYVHEGLPPTPIGAVGEKALEAMEHPAAGDWIYFVTVDAQGTTLFTRSFDQHRRNIGKACANKFITCN